MKFLSLDSPLMKFLNRMTDVLWLNILVILFCIPGIIGAYFAYHLQAMVFWLAAALISFPAGAAFTALHYVCLKLVRDEEGYITKDFFKSYKQNFKQGTIIWLLISVISVVLVIDYKCLGSMEGNVKFLFGAITAAAIFLLCTSLYVFPVLSHFVNTIKGTIKNAFLMSIFALPRTILMVLLFISPVALLYLVERFQTGFWIIPLVGLFCFSAPAYFRAKLYSKIFKKFEPESSSANDDFSWTVGGEDENGDQEVKDPTEE